MEKTKSTFNRIINGISGGMFSGVAGSGVYASVGAVSGAIIGDLVGIVIGGIVAGPYGSTLGAAIGTKLGAAMGATAFGGYGGISFMQRGVAEGLNDKLSFSKILNSVFSLQTPTILKVNAENGLTKTEMEYHINRKKLYYGVLIGLGGGILSTVFGANVILSVANDAFRWGMARESIAKLIDYIPLVMSATSVLGWYAGSKIGNYVAKKEIRLEERELRKKGLLKENELSKDREINKDSEFTIEDKKDLIMGRRLLYGAIGLGIGVIATNFILPAVGEIVKDIIYNTHGYLFGMDMDYFPFFIGLGALGGTALGTNYGAAKGNLDVERKEYKHQRESIRSDSKINEDRIQKKELIMQEIKKTPELEMNNNKENMEVKTAEENNNKQDISNELSIIEQQVIAATNELVKEENINNLMDQLNKAEEQLNKDVNKNKEQVADTSKEENKEVNKKEKLENINKEIQKDSMNKYR